MNFTDSNKENVNPMEAVLEKWKSWTPAPHRASTGLKRTRDDMMTASSKSDNVPPPSQKEQLQSSTYYPSCAVGPPETQCTHSYSQNAPPPSQKKSSQSFKVAISPLSVSSHQGFGSQNEPRNKAPLARANEEIASEEEQDEVESDDEEHEQIINGENDPSSLEKNCISLEGCAISDEKFFFETVQEVDRPFAKQLATYVALTGLKRKKLDEIKKNERLVPCFNLDNSKFQRFVLLGWSKTLYVIHNSKNYDDCIELLETRCKTIVKAAKELIKSQPKLLWIEKWNKRKTKKVWSRPSKNYPLDNEVETVAHILDSHNKLKEKLPYQNYYATVKNTLGHRANNIYKEFENIVAELDPTKKIPEQVTEEVQNVSGQLEPQSASENPRPEVPGLETSNLIQAPFQTSSSAADASQNPAGANEEESFPGNVSEKERASRIDSIIDMEFSSKSEPALESFYKTFLEAACPGTIAPIALKEGPVERVSLYRLNFNQLMTEGVIDPPHFINMIIGDMTELLWFQLMLRAESAKFRKLLAFSFMLPSSLSSSHLKHEKAQFLTTLQESLNSYSQVMQNFIHKEDFTTTSGELTWSFTEIKNSYGKNDIRQVYCFRRSDHAKRGTPLTENDPEIVKALNWCSKAFSKALPHGSHQTNKTTMINILNELNIQSNHVVWEIGIGFPMFASLLSYQTNNAVIANDLLNVFNLLADSIPTESESCPRNPQKKKQKTHHLPHSNARSENTSLPVIADRPTLNSTKPPSARKEPTNKGLFDTPPSSPTAKRRINTSDEDEEN